MHDDMPIRQIVARCQDAWNRGDAVGFVAPMAAEIDFIEVLGGHHTDRAELEAAHRDIFGTIYKDSRLTYTVERVRFLRDDVALAFVNARLLSHLATRVDDPKRAMAAPGAALREERARPTFIFARQEDGWKIVAFQNTRIAGVS